MAGTEPGRGGFEGKQLAGRAACLCFRPHLAELTRPMQVAGSSVLPGPKFEGRWPEKDTRTAISRLDCTLESLKELQKHQCRVPAVPCDRSDGLGKWEFSELTKVLVHTQHHLRSTGSAGGSSGCTRRLTECPRPRSMRGLLCAG